MSGLGVSWRPGALRLSWVCLAWGLALVQPAAAQSCPGGYAACDNGGCCLASDQCCPTLAEGCCSASTPFCCGDGTCAATPSQCQNLSQNGCSGYDLPCGSGCAPAGSECCDSAGHYCPPQATCTSDLTCQSGQVAIATLLVEATTPAVSTPPVLRTLSPLQDPAGSSDRACAVRVVTGGGGALLPALGLLVVVAQARTLRSSQARRKRGKTARYE
jgi:hypothetical protein